MEGVHSQMTDETGRKEQNITRSMRMHGGDNETKRDDDAVPSVPVRHRSNFWIREILFIISLFLHGVDLHQRVKCSIRNVPDVVVVEGEDC